MIETDRLLLRPWTPEDIRPFAAINKDKRVMEFLPYPLTDEETARFIDKIMKHFATYGFGLFACEKKDTCEMIGYVGLKTTTFEAKFTPSTEIGWRLGSRHWGKGYATEAAKIILSKAFTDYALGEVVSFTTPQNIRSRRVMEKLGMACDPADDFSHPAFTPEHPLSRHVLYRISKEKTSC